MANERASMHASMGGVRCLSWCHIVGLKCILLLTSMSVILSRPPAAALAPQVSQVGNAALVEREAVTLPLDHAIGFELADVGPAAIEMLR